MLAEDHCIYVKLSDKKFVILSLCIEDILLTGNDSRMIAEIVRDCSKRLIGLS